MTSPNLKMKTIDTYVYMIFSSLNISTIIRIILFSRLDETCNGILTVLCNHSFHAQCLVKWEDTTCPVCRSSQTPESSEDNECRECQAREDLWLCILCGMVGCGRYLSGHAVDHFRKTGHTYSMHLGNWFTKIDEKN